MARACWLVSSLVDQNSRMSLTPATTMNFHKRRNPPFMIMLHLAGVYPAILAAERRSKLTRTWSLPRSRAPEVLYSSA
ncbi:hypothetical protein BDW74DRAFT_160451 [Aspergillus multicolor]|uniref:uncharacterized protein n=1 Tax=Aspergillus multicolor TaxID=41759 RepID=UPI003CCE295C